MIQQYCSVCKAMLEMAVVDTVQDHDVTWLKCPRCNGILPHMLSREEETPSAADATPPALAPPPADSARGTTDGPHAAPAFAALTRRLADWALRVRGDGLWMEEHRARAQVEFSVSRWSGTGLRPGLAAGVEVGGRAERVADAWGTLRFAMPLR